MALHINTGPNVFQRNLGSQGTATSTGTATGASAASPTNSDNGSGQGLSISGSPPLIVAFLAVGLFLAAMLTIFGWRRVVFGRGFVLQPIVGDGFHAPGMAEHHHGEKPELWDVWTQPPVGSNEQLKWERIMPFSTSIMKSGEESFNDAEASGIHTHPRIPSQLQTIRQYIRRHRKSADEPKIDAGSAQNRTLRVAMAIAMPSPHKRECEPINEGLANADEHTHEPHDTDPLEYSLGLMEMPWHSEG